MKMINNMKLPKKYEENQSLIMKRISYEFQ